MPRVRIGYRYLDIPNKEYEQYLHGSTPLNVVITRDHIETTTTRETFTVIANNLEAALDKIESYDFPPVQEDLGTDDEDEDYVLESVEVIPDPDEDKFQMVQPMPGQPALC